MTNKYCPSTQTEGLFFMDNWCNKCEKDRLYRETQKDGCLIVVDTIAYDVESPDYPNEWTYDENDNPSCTAFIPEGELLYKCDKTVDMFNHDCKSN